MKEIAQTIFKLELFAYAKDSTEMSESNNGV